MNVLIISTPHPYKTSGVVAYNLYRGLKEKGCNVKILTKIYDKNYEEDIISIETPFHELKQKIIHKCQRIYSRFQRNSSKLKTNPDYHVQDFNQTVELYRTKRILKKIKIKPDVIFYLFQQNFLTAKNLYELNIKTGAPIFWYFMDTAPLTGICHYSWDCKGYTNGCGICPALFSNNKNDQSAINFTFKNKYLEKTDINIITASEWQYKKVAESLLFKNKPAYKVLLSIDSSVYNYLPKRKGKNFLGISSDKKVIFFGATTLSDKRKGMSFLIEALQIFRNRNENLDNILLLIAGKFNYSESLFPFEIKKLGLLEKSEEIASAYQASDVFVCPSIEDAGPMMINQSIMTGTPVVSFKMGVSEDLVRTGETGYLSKLKDSFDLAKGIESILFLDDNKHEQMCLNSRNLALNNYSFKVSSEKIMDLISKKK